ncbi:hypothetical protein [Sinorhizobium meliloti]|uniref:hypothetical protein n=1 Tax=Rhizobium meliloti TaxID=382 RepID=UPI00398C9C69
MLEELTKLLTSVDSNSDRERYRSAVVEDNILGKRSGKTRLLTFRHLVDLYGLDLALPVFKGLAYFWGRDSNGRRLLALLCACARDRVLQSSASLVLPKPEFSSFPRNELEAHIEALYPGRFSPATLKSTAQNINSSLTQAGHLRGRAHKIRSRAVATSGSAAYAVFLGYISGLRGHALFNSGFAKFLDCDPTRVLALSQEAAQKGWLKLNQIGDVVEVDFPNLLTDADREMLREQD